MKISELKVVVICPDHNEHYHYRKEKTLDLLKNLGFKEIIHHKSGTYNYPACLREATINVLKQYIDEPILIVEDDLGYSGIDSFEYEDGIDAYYLGISKFGGHPTENTHLGNSKFVPHSDSMVRVVNMLSAHAVFYVSKKYKEAVIDILSKYTMEEGEYNDILMTRIQNDYNILAVKNPIFFQSKRFDAPVECTNFTILDDLTFGPPQEEVVLTTH